MARHLVIDTDTASDDAVALVMALRHPDVVVDAITVVAGNVDVDQGVQNALYVRDLCGSDVPVHRGMDRPLLRPLDTARYAHGHDGMGDIGLDLTGRQPAAGHGVDVLREALRHTDHTVELVAIGPLTNVALALLLEPELAESVERFVWMGGAADHHGNVTAIAEYNAWADPEAAKAVFESGIPIEMVGWDISRTDGLLTADVAAELRALGTPLAEMAIDIQQGLRRLDTKRPARPAIAFADPVAMAAALEPRATESVRRHVSVVAGDGPARGLTLTDHRSTSPAEPNVQVVTRVSPTRYVDLLRQSLS